MGGNPEFDHRELSGTPRVRSTASHPGFRGPVIASLEIGSTQRTKTSSVGLNLGCGMVAIPGFVGVDREPGPSVEVQADVRRLPFRDSSIDEVYAAHVIEHLHEPDAFMRELHRVLKIGGRAVIRTPRGLWGLLDPFHYHAFDEHSFDVWTGRQFASLQPQYLFDLESTYVSWESGFLMWHLGRYAPWLANRLPQHREWRFDGKRRYKIPWPSYHKPPELTVIIRKYRENGERSQTRSLAGVAGHQGRLRG